MGFHSKRRTNTYTKKKRFETQKEKRKQQFMTAQKSHVDLRHGGKMKDCTPVCKDYYLFH